MVFDILVHIGVQPEPFHKHLTLKSILGRLRASITLRSNILQGPRINSVGKAQAVNPLHDRFTISFDRIIIFFVPPLILVLESWIVK